MNLTDLFPRKYACGDDLQGKAITVTIANLSLEAMHANAFGSSTQKPVLYFKETKKGVVLCKTLAYQVADITGSVETDAWTGKSITLYPEPVSVGGRPHTAIRARRPETNPL